jgi:prepilin-type N-terminal cleavage/methylation domain-containing protein
MSDNAERKRSLVKRTHYFIDARMQLALALPLLAVLAIVGLAYATAVYLLPGEMALQTMTSEETRQMFLRANATYYAIAAVLVCAVAIFLTHRIAGPARIIERALRDLLRGEGNQRIALRPDDSLQSLASTVNELSSQLQEQEARRAKLIHEIDSRLETNDVAAARELLTELESTEPREAVAETPSGRKAGFTIIELMIVVGLIGIITTLAIPSFLRFQLRTKVAECRTNLSAIRKAEESYYAEYNIYVSAQPAAPVAVGQLKVPWGLSETDAHGFNTIGFTPEGELYFQYAVTSDTTSYTIAARSDLDGDSVYNTWGYVKPKTGSLTSVTGPFGTCPATGVFNPSTQAPNTLLTIGPCDLSSGASVF